MPFLFFSLLGMKLHNNPHHLSLLSVFPHLLKKQGWLQHNQLGKMSLLLFVTLILRNDPNPLLICLWHRGGGIFGRLHSPIVPTIFPSHRFLYNVTLSFFCECGGGGRGAVTASTYRTAELMLCDFQERGKMTKDSSLDVWLGGWDGREPGRSRSERDALCLIAARVPYLLQSGRFPRWEVSSVQSGI